METVPCGACSALLAIPTLVLRSAGWPSMKTRASGSELRPGDTRLRLAGNIERTPDDRMNIDRLGGRLPEEQHARPGSGNGHLAAMHADTFGEGLDESSGHGILPVDYITTSAPALTMTWLLVRAIDAPFPF